MQDASGIGALLAINVGTNSIHFCAYDGNGNVVSLIGATNGARSATYGYDAFGRALIFYGAMARLQPFRFSTKYYDQETQTIYYGMRDLALAMGRWLNRDPIVERGGINVYVFVKNAATLAYDPLGKQGTLGGASCCRCGPDVTAAIGRTLLNVGAVFNNASPSDQRSACASISGTSALSSWDMLNIQSLSWDTATDPISAWRRALCPQCEKAFTYKGKCFNQDDLAYIFIGYAANLCGVDLSVVQTQVELGLNVRSLVVPTTSETISQRSAFVGEGHNATAGGSVADHTLISCKPSSEKIQIGTQQVGSVDPTLWRWEPLRE